MGLDFSYAGCLWQFSSHSRACLRCTMRVAIAVDGFAAISSEESV